MAVEIKFICEDVYSDSLEIKDFEDTLSFVIRKKINDKECDIDDALSVNLKIEDIKLLIFILNEKIKNFEGGKNG